MDYIAAGRGAGKPPPPKPAGGQKYRRGRVREVAAKLERQKD